jgi:hypothetical protein
LPDRDPGRASASGHRPGDEQHRGRADAPIVDGHVRLTDRAPAPQRAQWQAKLLLARRPGGPTLGAVAVGRVLLDLLGQDGRLDPCLDTIAQLARVHVATVVRALAQLRSAGLLAWTRRLARAGWRAVQISNAYQLQVPACDTHFAAEVRFSFIKTAREVGRAAPPVPPWRRLNIMPPIRTVAEQLMLLDV